MSPPIKCGIILFQIYYENNNNSYSQRYSLDLESPMPIIQQLHDEPLFLYLKEPIMIWEWYTDTTICTQIHSHDRVYKYRVIYSVVWTLMNADERMNTKTENIIFYWIWRDWIYGYLAYMTRNTGSVQRNLRSERNKIKQKVSIYEGCRDKILTYYAAPSLPYVRMTQSQKHNYSEILDIFLVVCLV